MILAALAPYVNADVYAYDPVSGALWGHDRVGEGGNYQVELWPPPRPYVLVIRTGGASGRELAALAPVRDDAGSRRVDVSLASTVIYLTCLAIAGEPAGRDVLAPGTRSSLELANLALRLPPIDELEPGIRRLMAAPWPQSDRVPEDLAAALAGNVRFLASEMSASAPDGPVPSQEALALAIVQGVAKRAAQAAELADPRTFIAGARDTGTATMDAAAALDRLAIGQHFPTPAPPAVAIADRLPTGGEEGRGRPEPAETPLVFDVVPRTGSNDGVF